MKIGLAMGFSQHTAAGFIRDAAQLLEDKDIHAIWLPEHVMFFPDHASSYPYSDNGRIPGDPEGLLDPFTAMTFIAAHTSKLRLGTGICLVPQRQPVYTAKMVADVDYLSGGRVDFGIGVGWLKEEFDNLGVDFSQRGRLCDEYIDTMKALWSEGIAEFTGPTVQLAPCYFNPKPVQTPHPPIIVGGESKAALRRVAQKGQGWYGFDLTPQMLAEQLPLLEAELSAAGRSREDIALIISPNRHPVNADTIAEYRALGVDQLVAPMSGSTIEKLSGRIDRLLENAGG
ncbi:MAG: LLM class F420-dependent oxidoreductase [Pseudomonadota bacterium]